MEEWNAGMLASGPEANWACPLVPCNGRRGEAPKFFFAEKSR